MNQETDIRNLPEIIPIFPLDKCVLLPKAILPLNIFEPRYLEMIDDAMKKNKYIGIIQPSVSKRKRVIQSVLDALERSLLMLKMMMVH